MNNTLTERQTNRRTGYGLQGNGAHQRDVLYNQK